MSLISDDVDYIISKIQAKNIVNLCRFCLTDKSMFLQHSAMFDMELFAQQFLKISLSGDNTLPSYVCEACLTSLTLAYEFREQCKKADKILRMLSSRNVGIFNDKTVSDLDIKEEYLGNTNCDKKTDNEVNSDNKSNELNADQCSLKIEHYEYDAEADGVSSDDEPLNLKKCNVNTARKTKGKLLQNEKRYKCKYCDRTFTQKNPLQYHEKTHTGERPYVCDICGKSYIQPNNLIVHKRNHTGEKPFVCKECGKGFTNGAGLMLHMPIHTGVKNFVCTICGKGMARRGELTIHMRTHTGEKPYVCCICSKGFIKKSSLQAHSLSHTGEKNYVCPICGHRVAHAGKLTIHIRTHSNDKPYSCNICNRNFATRGYLKQHSKIHLGKGSSQCSRGFVKNKTPIEHNTKLDLDSPIESRKSDVDCVDTELITNGSQ